MKKLITLVAVAALAASPLAFAEDQTPNSNPNDVMQAAPGQDGNNGQMNVADNSSAAPAQAADQNATDSKPAVKKHHRKHHTNRKHHRNHAKQPADAQTASNDATATQAPTEAPAQLADNSDAQTQQTAQ